MMILSTNRSFEIYKFWGHYLPESVRLIIPSLNYVMSQ